MDKQYPHGLGYRRQLTDLRDFTYTAYPEQVAILPPYADIRAQDTPILQQGGIGSCHDSETEVLTIQGWKLFKDITYDDKLASANPETSELIFEHPIGMTAYRYDGDMYHFKHQALDCCVTPNHKMLVRAWSTPKRTLNEEYSLTNASDVGWYAGLMNHVDYFGDFGPLKTESVMYSYQPVERKNIGGPALVNNTVDLKYWLRFLGMYVAEGTMNNTSYEIQLACAKEPQRKYILDFIDHLNIGRTVLKDRVKINNKEIYSELTHLGLHKVKAPYKFVPDFVFTLPTEYIKEFLDGFFRGDGCGSSHNKMYYTSSEKLAGQLQALIILAGGWASISVRGPRESVIRGRRIKGKFPEHTVIEWTTKNLSIETKANLTIEPYSGMVYCAEVPTFHTLVTRREGKVIISGNCTAHAGVGVFMYLQNKRLGTYTMGSRLYIYYRTRHDIEGVSGDVGATLRDTAKEMAKFGVPPETDWPYNEDKYDVEPPAKAGVDAKKFVSTNYYLCDGPTPTATINNIKAAVAIVGLPVMFGTTVYEQIMDVGSNGMIAKPGGKVAGGHAMDIVGYDDDRQCFLIKNSWGEGWGMCISGDTKIPLLSGEDVPVSSLVGQAPFWVYAYDTERKGIYPALATECELTKKMAAAVTVHLDNGEKITCTPAHRFLLRNGEYKEAANLSEGDSLMPLYRSLDKDGYTKIACNSEYSWLRTHWLVAREMRMFEGHDGAAVIHHKNFDKTDNTPENLVVMSPRVHSSYHRQQQDTAGLKEAWKRNYESWVEISRKNISDYNEKIVKGEVSVTEKQREARRQNMINLNAATTPEERHIKAKKMVATKIERYGTVALGMCGKYQRTEKHKEQAREMCSHLADYRWYKNHEPEPMSYKEWAVTYNHKVVKVESHEPEDMYDLCVPQYHNFATSAGVFIHNSGYGFLPYTYFTKGLANDCWVIAAESELDNPVPPEPLPEASICKLRAFFSRLYERIRKFFTGG